ncbi:hypothetical protein Godav_021333, partial [Gossypium davidsonii]|nr:hypothetical protein [Gossypium davidsonii]
MKVSTSKSPFLSQYTRREHRKGTNQSLTWYHSSVRCFGFTMHSLRRMLCFSSPSTLSAFSFRLFTLLFTFTMAQRRK